MTRNDARELLMQLMFQMWVRDDYSDEIRDAFLEEHKTGGQREYIERVLAGAVENLEDIDAKLDDISDKWKTSRMSNVDLTVLRIAAAEILYAEDIPSAVSINEAVRIAKKYGTDESGRFVNGILGRFAEKYGSEE